MKRLLILFLAAVIVGSAAAKPAKAKAVKATVRPAASGPVETAYRKLPCVGAVVVNAENGERLYENNAEAAAFPASVTKLMTALLVLEDLKAGRYRLDDLVTATSEVYRSEPSWVGLKDGEKMSVRDLLRSLMVESANDAAIALAVNSSGSLAGFVQKMNDRAAALGMKNTTYYNPNGLPPNPNKRYPWKKFNVTTAADQALLALELVRNHPSILDFTSVKTCDLIKTSFGYRTSVTRRTNGGAPIETRLQNGEKLIKAQRNHNNVMVKDKLKILNPDGSEAVDGLKTGYIAAGGSSVILTGKRGDKRVIVIVLGSATAEARDEEARRLMIDALGSLVW